MGRANNSIKQLGDDGLQSKTVKKEGERTNSRRDNELNLIVLLEDTFLQNSPNAVVQDKLLQA